ncbi:DNA repair protein RAD4-like isoform X1 [Zingiber officinale]|uniref:DNA repair protein RAD4-like isoform X1 n=1 Tax=Zingiber officinale TaxID=94328 RepID=UPI001C4AF53E|nr:DNA repair protein RAD4-like isoform X1 [Zingiber officinale]
MRTRNQSKSAEPPPAPVDSEAGTSTGSKPKRRRVSGSADSKITKRSKKATSDALVGGKQPHETGTSDAEREEKVKVLVGKNSEGKDAKENANEIELKGCDTRNDKASTSIASENVGDDANELVWEEGRVPVSENKGGYSYDAGRELTIEFTDTPSSSGKKLPRRFSAKDKELAELVHKVHLLCLLARGRIVDDVCNDPLIQASLLSLLPPSLLAVGEIQKLTANGLYYLVNWFRDNFQVRSHNTDRGSFKENLAFALQTHEGTAEEVAALSVALFRALDLTTRFVSVLDVASLKPDTDMIGITKQDTGSLDIKISSPSTSVLVPHQIDVPSDVKSLDKTNDHIDLASTSRACNDQLNSCATNLAQVSKRKGDMEFVLELERAISATAAAVPDDKVDSKSDELPDCSVAPTTSVKMLRQNNAVDSSVSRHSSSGALWSRRTGPPLYWAEVYCNGESSTGRWVHVDAANAVIDGSEKVESAAAASRKPLRYVVAFAGKGAKDVTRRYCMHWYKIAPKRISSDWWDSVVAPLKTLESAVTGSVVQLEQLQATSIESENDPDRSTNKVSKIEASVDFHGSASRASLEDMELATRALTEPLPTNQLAYKNHHLYAIEKWLTKTQVLHPKGPILGYCSGHPVYPRSCVKTLQTKQKWLREGLQVRAGETPAKVLRRSKYSVSDQTSEMDDSIEISGQPSTELFGMWQLEPLQLPHAANGIVPKNERGQVEVWSEKCLPPGTVHLRLPRSAPVAKRLEIDFAPAMVGFDFRNGRCVPMFDGIVVCSEFKNGILEAYAEEEERRESEERKRIESQALSRWFQLLSSIITRQKLKNSYVVNSSAPPHVVQENVNTASTSTSKFPEHGSVEVLRPLVPAGHDHVHVYPAENQSFDEETMVRTKRCPCGFSIEVEEL